MLIEKEILFKSFNPNIKTVHIGIFPARGRYFREEMNKIGEGVYNLRVRLPKGKSFYHYFFNKDFSKPENNEEVVISEHDPQKRASLALQTRVFCPIEFSNESNFISYITLNTWEIRVITHHKWIDQVSILLDSKEYALRLSFCDKNLKFWVLRIDVFTSIIRLCVKFFGGGQTRFLHRDGIRSFPVEDFFFHCHLNKTSHFVSKYLTCGYQIMPDRFHKLINHQEFNVAEHSNSNDFFGGDILGITSKLNYLAKLGIDFIYLTPIFISKSYHRYDCSDYRKIDPKLGTDEDLLCLVESAHRLNIKIFLDISLNHCGVDFPPFKDLIANQNKSLFASWFVIEDFPVKIQDNPNYSAWHGYKDMPQFNFDSKEVVAYFLEIARYWPQKYKIDGWRLDVCSELPIDFVEKFIQETKKVNADLIVIGEFWQNWEYNLVTKSGLDGVTNFGLYLDAMMLFFEKESISLNKLVSLIMHGQVKNSFCENQMSWNFLSNHDLPRFYSIIKDKRKYSLAFIFMFSLLGTPIIYYGEEVYMEGFSDPDNRRAMDFELLSSEFLHGHTVVIRNLNILKKKHPDVFAFGTIGFPLIHDLKKTLIIQRTYLEEHLLFILNFDSSVHVIDLISNEKLGLKSNEVELLDRYITIKAYSSIVISIKQNEINFYDLLEGLPDKTKAALL